MSKPSHPNGFTLLEMVVVVLVLILLASLIIGKFDKVRDDASITVTRATLNTVREALVGSAGAAGYLSNLKTVPGFDATKLKMRDLLDPGSYPSTVPYDPVAQRGWRGPYLDNVQSVLNTNVARNGLFPAASEKRTNRDTSFLERHFYESNSVTGSKYGEPGDRCAADPWGNPIVVQVPPDSAFTTSTPKKRFHFTRIVSAGPDGILDTPLDLLAGMLSDGTATARGDDLVIFLNRADIYATEDEQ